MPRIPVYEQSQSQTQTLPSPSINPVMPDASAGIREGVQDMMRTINKAREEANAFRVEDGLNRLNPRLDTLLYGDNTPDQPAQSTDMKGVAFQVAKAAQPNRERGALNVKGEQVYSREGGKPLSDEYSAKYDAEVKLVADTLSNDDQRKQFMLRAARLKDRFNERVRAHEYQQGEVYKEGVYKGSIAVENERAARYFDDSVELESAMSRVVEVTSQFALSKGMGKEATKALILEAQSNLHSIVINRLLEEQRPLAAKAYFDKHRAAIDAKDTTAAIKAVGVVGIDAEVSDYVDTLIKTSEFGPQGNDRQAFQTDKLAGLIREKYKDNPAARDVGLRKLNEHKIEWNDGVKERLQNDNGQTVNVAVSLVQDANKPTTDDGNYDLEKAIKQLREDQNLKDKPDLLAKAEARLTQDYNVWLAASTKRNEERVGKLWGLVEQGVALEAIQKSEHYKQLGPVLRKKFEDDLLRDEEQRSAASAARESRDWAREQRANSKNEDAIWSAAGRGDKLDAITKMPEWANLPGGIQERLRQQIASARNTEELRKLQEKQRQENANRDAVWDAVLEKRPMKSIRAMPEWNALGGTDRAELEDRIENFRKPNAPSAASKEEIRINQDARYQMLTEDTDRVSQMSEDQIRALVPDIGLANANKVITLKRRLQTESATVKFDKDLLDSRAYKAGIPVYDADGKTEKGKRIKATMAQLNDRAEEVILAKQKVLKRPLRDEEKIEVIDTLLKIGPVRMQQQGGLFGSGSISFEDRRLFEVRDPINNFGRPGDREKVIKYFNDNYKRDPTEDELFRSISNMNKKK